MADHPVVLGIETSCDETGIGIVRGHDLLANEIKSLREQMQSAQPNETRSLRDELPPHY